MNKLLLWTMTFCLLLLLAACGGGEANESAESTYDVVEPGTHPGIVFSKQELPALRERAQGDTMAAAAYRKLKAMAEEIDADLTIEELVEREGVTLAHKLEALALVYQVEQDEAMGRRAVELFDKVATETDPVAFYKEVGSDFFATEHWPKAFAFAWDWLYELMSDAERERILSALEAWNAALFEHTESNWWREAHWNCGTIPNGAQGMLLMAIRGESDHPQFDHWFSECLRKVTENYYRSTWRPSGINREGPGYAHYHKNATQFAEALRRTSGPDVIPQSRAVKAMDYMMHQWMPQGECGPIGDNTNYSNRVFQSIYLHGIRERRDQAGLWTFLNKTDFDRINPLPLFLYYPDHLEPVSPGTLDLRTSAFFEVDVDLAGILFSRSEWDNEEAAWFAAGNRHSVANHTHYDMNTFLFAAFGELFATHDNIYGYRHPHHGVDFEHNIVIIDEGGMPADDRQSAGDDGSLYSYTTGLALGHFADYFRGDARRSYADHTVPSSTPARRADRAILFVKQGPNPYVFVADDIQKGDGEHDYHWQWYTHAMSVSGQGVLDDPLRIEAEGSRCDIAFLAPEAPRHEFRIVKGEGHQRPVELGLLRVNRRGDRVRFLAIGAASRQQAEPPRFSRGPAIEGNPDAASLVVQGQGYRDLIVWQPDDSPQRISSGDLTTDAQLALVRLDRDNNIAGYLMADGTALDYNGQTLARAQRGFSVSADSKRSVATGARQAREERPPLPAAGTFWLPSADSEVWVDDERVHAPAAPDRTVTVAGTGSE